MSRAIRAGLVYFALTFLAGIALGALRSLILAPILGATPAVVLELPLMLLIAWILSRALIGAFGVRRQPAQGFVMGLTALLSLLVAEAALSTLVLGHSFGEHLRSYQAAPGLLGLVAQMLSALFPVFQMRWSQSAHR